VKRRQLLRLSRDVFAPVIGAGLPMAFGSAGLSSNRAFAAARLAAALTRST
jgi:hypothetical protein